MRGEGRNPRAESRKKSEFRSPNRRVNAAGTQNLQRHGQTHACAAAGVRPSSGAATSARSEGLELASVPGASGTAAPGDPAPWMHSCAHKPPRRFPLLLWRRGPGRGGRYSRAPGQVSEIGTPREGHCGRCPRNEWWASSPQPSPPEEERVPKAGERPVPRLKARTPSGNSSPECFGLRVSVFFRVSGCGLRIWRFRSATRAKGCGKRLAAAPAKLETQPR